MEVIPLASESLGVRSLSLYIENRNDKIIIDPGVALGPRRYRLPPASVEFKALEHYRGRVLDYLERAATVIISHYHYDHYIPDADYTGKHLLLKHPKRDINTSQMSRASRFIKKLGSFEYVDGRKLEFVDFEVKFSPPVYHGEAGSKLGYVIMSIIDGKSRIAYASDSQLLNQEAVEWLIDENPDIVITSGPPVYIGYMKKTWDMGIKNMNRLFKETGADMILDHHILRDKGYPMFFKSLEEEPLTFAGYLGVEETPLEAYRRELHHIESGIDAEIPFGLPF